MNLPNKLTVLRMVMIPFFLFFYFADFVPYHMVWAFLIFVVASLTDMLDGKLARKYNLVTNFGKLMDPLADKLLVTSAMVCILGQGYLSVVWYQLDTAGINMLGEAAAIVPIMVLILVLSRDLIVNSIRQVAANNGIVIAADIYGKMKTACQMVWLAMVMLRIAYINEFLFAGNWFEGAYMVYFWIESVLYWGMIILTVFSGLNYVIKNRHMFADA